jgi:hypothetical protein
VAGAVYNPEEEIVPPVAVHVTAVLLEPVTVAVNCWVAPVSIDCELGLMSTETGGGSAETFIATDADFVESALLVAVTV